jgi:hypothetical protein
MTITTDAVETTAVPGDGREPKRPRTKTTPADVDPGRAGGVSRMTFAQVRLRGVAAVLAVTAAAVVAGRRRLQVARVTVSRRRTARTSWWSDQWLIRPSSRPRRSGKNGSGVPAGW